MSDQIADYMERLGDTFINLTRNLASWRSFATNSRELPIVTYHASVNGVKSLEVASDLSKLPVGDAETIKAILSQHHGAQVLAALESVASMAGEFRSHLTAPSTAENEGEELPADSDIPESDYPEDDFDDLADTFKPPAPEDEHDNDDFDK